MWIAGALLVILTAEIEPVTENFTGKVLDGSTTTLLRVERGQDKRKPESIVVLEDCGPLETGSVHEFAVWAGSKDAVLPCLAVNGKPPMSIQRRMPAGFGVIYGQVRTLDGNSNTVKQFPGAPVEVRCGDKVWNGQTDRRGRFWTMLPAGTCYLDHQVAGYRPIDVAPTPFQVQEGRVGAVLLRLEPWGFKERIEGLFRGLLPK